jgi:LmbE family N-acetylglucosaminyl deacetylase
MPMLSAVPQAPDHAAVCAERGRWALAGLSSIAPAVMVPEGRRAVVVTPDPDDEVVSLGGLIHGLHFLGRPLTIIAATGEPGAASSHNPPEYDGEAQVQYAPYSGALHRLGVTGRANSDMAPCRVMHAGMQKGTLHRNETVLAAFLAWRLQPGDVMFASWRFDGDPDHEAVGRAALAAAAIVGAKCIPVPVHAWAWATPGDTRIPWHRARRIEVDQYGLYAKRKALSGDRVPGDPQLGSATARQPYEIVLL